MEDIMLKDENATCSWNARYIGVIAAVRQERGGPTIKIALQLIARLGARIEVEL
jgi:hypothetical protein